MNHSVLNVAAGLAHRAASPSRHGRRLLTVLVGLLACAAVSSSPLTARQEIEPREIQITARRYTFEPSIVEVTQGEPVRLMVTAADGMHGFAIKKFKVDKEIMPNTTVKIDFVAREAGEFPIMCTVICGEGHASMTGTLKVVAKAQQ